MEREEREALRWAAEAIEHDTGMARHYVEYPDREQLADELGRTAIRMFLSYRTVTDRNGAMLNALPTFWTDNVEYRAALRLVAIDIKHGLSAMVEAMVQPFPPSALMGTMLDHMRTDSGKIRVVNDLLFALGIHACGHEYPGWPDMTCDRLRGHAPPHSNIAGGDDEYEFVSGESCVEECDVSTLVLLLLAILDGPENAADAIHNYLVDEIDMTIVDTCVGPPLWIHVTSVEADGFWMGEVSDAQLPLLAIRLAAATTAEDALAALRETS